MPRSTQQFVLSMAAAMLALGCAGSVQDNAQPGPSQDMTARVDVSALGPQVGEQVPDFTLGDQTGQTWTRESIMGPRGAMLVFMRSADW